MNQRILFYDLEAKAKCFQQLKIDRLDGNLFRREILYIDSSEIE